MESQGPDVVSGLAAVCVTVIQSLRHQCFWNCETCPSGLLHDPYSEINEYLL